MKTETPSRRGPFAALRELYSLRPVSAVSTVLCTLWAAAFFILENHKYDAAFLKDLTGLWEDLLNVLILFTMSVFLLENAFPRLKGFKKGGAACLSAVLAFLFGALADAADFRPALAFGRSLKALFGERCGAFCAGYAVILAVVILWVCCKNAGAKDLSAYALPVFVRAALAGCVTLIVLLGLLLLEFIMDELLWETPYWLMDVFLILPFGLWFCPKAECALIEGGGETPRFGAVIVRKVLLWLCAAAYAVVYVYLFKILITWTFPENTVFSILTALFAVSLPVAVMSRDEEKGDLSHKLAKLFPGLFVPFTAMQALCLFMRISEYGLTTARYLGIALILFELVFCLWLCFSPRTVSRTLPVLAALAAVCVFAPKIDCVTLPDVLQAETLRAALTADLETLPDMELSRIRAASSYRGSGDARRSWLDRYFSAEERAQADGLKERLPSVTIKGAYINLYFSVKWPLEVSGYRRLYSAESERFSADSTPPPLTAVPLYDDSEPGVLLTTVDLSETAASLLADYLQDPGFESSASPEVILPDGSILFLRSFWFDYREDEVILRQVSGWLLVK